MKWIKSIIIALALLGAAAAIYAVTQSERALVLHPKGVIAQGELDILSKNIHLMLIVVIPTLLFLFATIWIFRAKNRKAKYDPEHSPGRYGQAILWTIPSIFVAVMILMTWEATHRLDPYRPIQNGKPPLTIQVVALDWKWLFIYPEQGIAAVNDLRIPEQTPIRLELSADGSPMNGFWIPQLSGQIYCMAGMRSVLHIMADAPGSYAGRASEINGKGLADMTFTATSSTKGDFDAWVATVKQSPLRLTSFQYEQLAKPSENNPVALYSQVEENLFTKIVLKYTHPHTVWKTSLQAN